MDASVNPLSRYRADIDGLRAIAVLAVLLTHLGIGWMGGGYVGVDMFFVISGYVVFGDLSRRAETGPVSPVAFYVRRARRLLPNLAAMSLSSTWASR
jgi:peptidoglycan/LPS O-acetylase OafA/YrhL